MMLRSIVHIRLQRNRTLGSRSHIQANLIPAILMCMFAALLLVLHPPFSPSIEQLDRLAQARSVVELSRLLEPGAPKGHNPFNIIKTNGAYEVGKFGWHALPLKGPGTVEYVVFSTPLTSEDTGELVFERVGDKLQFVPETEAFGVKLIRHDFNLTFFVPSKKAVLIDRLKLKPLDGVGGTFLFRMSPQYIVSSIANQAGESLRVA